MLKFPILYLSRNAITADGTNLTPEFRKKPVFVMFQSRMCGHCTTAKPDFQRLADEGLVKCMTVDASDERQKSEVMPLLNRLYPGIEGYPSYMLYLPNGRKIPYVGKRDFASLKNFVLKYAL